MNKAALFHKTGYIRIVYIQLVVERQLRLSLTFYRFPMLLKLRAKIFLAFVLFTAAQTGAFAQVSTIATNGWAANSVNTVIFRKNSLISFKDTQYAAFYDARQFMVLAKRKQASAHWQTLRTVYKADAADAHKSISIMLDGEGYLHVAWGHHNQPLNYARGVAPGRLTLSQPLPMTGLNEDKVTYPEFYKLPSGDLLFFYRDGQSGNGNLVLNCYSVKSKKWLRVQDNLIDGEKARNAYWQIAVDGKGVIHLSWVWRESADVASNHDMCYAVSKDGGISWQKSTGEKYQLPITMATAEQICSIPQNNELINQTSICTDSKNYPYVASYWRGKNNVPQYHIIYNTGKAWEVKDLGFRKTNFSLSGGGTKKIPISRPQVISWGNGKSTMVAIIFRDEERGNKVSMASGKISAGKDWELKDLNDTPTGAWEPTYDIPLWNKKQQLHLFVQQVFQADSEGVVNTVPQMVQVIELNTKNK